MGKIFPQGLSRKTAKRGNMCPRDNYVPKGYRKLRRNRTKKRTDRQKKTHPRGKKKERELKGQISKPRPIEQSLKRGMGLPKARRGEPNCNGPKQTPLHK